MKNLLTYFALLFSIVTLSQNTLGITDFFIELKYGIHFPTNGNVIPNSPILLSQNSYDEADNLIIQSKEVSNSTIESNYSLKIKELIFSFQTNPNNNLISDINNSGASYVVLNLGQSDGRYCSPNKTFEQLILDPHNNIPNTENISGYLTPKVGVNYDTIYSSPKVDLPLALSSKLDSDIKLFLYMSLDGPTLLKEWREEASENGNRVFTEHFIVEERMGLQVNTDRTNCTIINNNELNCSDNTDTVGLPLRAITGYNHNEISQGMANGTVLNLYKAPNQGVRFQHFSITDEFVTHLGAIIEEWSLRYGDKIAGWYFDHSFEKYPYSNDLGNHGFKECHYSTIRNAAISGNPKAIITFSDGPINPTPDGIDNASDHTIHQDFLWGETSPTYSNGQDFSLQVLKEIWRDELTNSSDEVNRFRGRRVLDDDLATNLFSQTHFIIPMADFWAQNNVNTEKKADSFNPYLFDAIKENQVTTISLANILDPLTFGRIPPVQLDELELINTFVNTDNCNYKSKTETKKIVNVRSGLFIKTPENNLEIVTQEYSPQSNMDDANFNWFIEDINAPIPHVPNSEIDSSEIESTRLVRIFNTDTHKYLTIQGGLSAVKTRIIQTYWNDWGTQKWILIKLTNGKYAIKSVQHPNRYITVNLGSMTPAELQISDWNNWGSQKWELRHILLYKQSSTNTLQHFESENLIIYPNPTKSNIILSLKNSESETIKSIEILDSNGILIFSNKKVFANQFNYSLKEFRHGIYFLRVITNRKVYLKKVIKH